MSELFRIADIEIFAVGEGQCLARARHAAPVLLAEADARLLASCGDYLPLEDHARAWAAWLDRQRIQQASQHSPRWLARVLDATAKAAGEPPAKLVAQTQAKLRGLAEAGLLVSRSSFPAQASAEAPGPIERLGFTTRRRVPELRRALESYAANFEAFGRSPEIVIIDDSRTPSDEADTERMLAEVQRESGLAVRFAGLAERESYIDALARDAGMRPDVARFALLGEERCPITTGSARNSLLLDCATTGYVLADDDGICRLVEAPGAAAGIDIVSRNDPTQFWYFETRDALHAQLELRDDVDLFALHETLLGRSVAQLAGDHADLSGATPAFEGRLRRQGGRVRTSMAGVVGDSGVASTAYLSAEPRSRDRLTVSEDFYHAAVANRQMLRAPQRATVGEGFLTMAGNLAIDATDLFPPFPPVQRNSDGVMGRLLQNCFPASCRGYLNWAVLHDPVAPRSQSLDAWFDEIRSIRFADVLSVFLRERGAEAALDDPGQALSVLGARLMRLGKASRETFREELRSRIVAREASRLAHIRSADFEGIPEFYIELHERYAETMREAVTRDEYLLPRDLPTRTLELTQSLVNRIGELLAVWPRLWSAATWLRANGRRMSRPVA